MLNSVSVRARLLVSIGSTGLRGVAGFLVIILIARALDPADYGSLMFLMGTFASIRGLLDMGTASAFYTFISRRARALEFYGAYFLWLSLQFIVTILLITILIPDNLFNRVWLGHSREVVLTCFVAVFFQQQLMPQFLQIGESLRKSIKVQMILLSVTACYLLAFFVLYISGELTQQRVLHLMALQGILGSVAIFTIVRKDIAESSDQATKLDYRMMFVDYWQYCRPLMVLSLVTFAYDFADKWLLQFFGGAEQQGFFQIANQFSNAVLLITTAIVNILWKEIAVAWSNGDRWRIENLYKRANRGLVFFGALVCGMALPWTDLIITTFAGRSYESSWLVLAIMLVYPIHIPMGVIGGATLLAVGATSKHMLLCVAGMLLSMPVTYLMLAPHSSGGMALGAIGLAIKLILFNVVTVNIQSIVIAKTEGWKWDWKFQVVGISLMIFNGYFAKTVVGFIWGDLEGGVSQMALPFLTACIAYAGGAALIAWFQPWLLGFTHDELSRIGRRFRLRGP